MELLKILSNLEENKEIDLNRLIVYGVFAGKDGKGEIKANQIGKARFSTSVPCLS